MDEWILVLYENGQVKIRHQLQNASFHGEVVITVEFEFHDDTNVLTLSNILVKTAIQLIKDEFDEHFGTNGLRNEIFTIEDTLTATVVEYEMSDYGEKEHDDDKYDDIGDDDDDDDDDKNNDNDNVNEDDDNNDNDDVNEDDDNNDNDDVIDIIRRWVGHDNMDIVRRWVGQDYDGDEEESEEEEEEEEDDDDDDDDDEDEVNYRPDPQSRD